MDNDERLRTIELGAVRLEETVKAVQHDVKNIRQMVSAANQVQEVRHNQLETDIKELSRVLLRLGISVISSIVVILISIIGYFLVQKDHTYSTTTTTTSSSPQQQVSK